VANSRDGAKPLAATPVWTPPLAGEPVEVPFGPHSVRKPLTESETPLPVRVVRSLKGIVIAVEEATHVDLGVGHQVSVGLVDLGHRGSIKRASLTRSMGFSPSSAHDAKV
jgi:hypothetical protein